MDRSTTTLCFCCLSSIRPEIVPLDKDDAGIAITGTSTGDVYSLSEMIDDGFDKKEASDSIKAVGKAIGLSTNVIRERLKG